MMPTVRANYGLVLNIIHFAILLPLANFCPHDEFVRELINELGEVRT